jgi:hypothetical protein
LEREDRPRNTICSGGNTMMTYEEQETILFTEFSKVKKDFESVLKKKVNRKNFKEAIIDLTKIAVNTQFDSEIDADIRERLSEFFAVCQPYLGEVIWSKIKEKTLKISIDYGDDAMVSWNIPVETFFVNQKQFELSIGMLVNSFKDCFLGLFLCPELREAVIQGDELAVKALYSSFSRPSMESTVINLKLFKECFPEFYNHITTNLDIMKLEDMKDFIKNKNKEVKKPIKKRKVK